MTISVKNILDFVDRGMRDNQTSMKEARAKKAEIRNFFNILRDEEPNDLSKLSILSLVKKLKIMSGFKIKTKTAKYYASTFKTTFEDLLKWRSAASENTLVSYPIVTETTIGRLTIPMSISKSDEKRIKSLVTQIICSHLPRTTSEAVPTQP